MDGSSGVSFEEDQPLVRPQVVRKKTPGLTELIQKWGFAKDAAGAETVMIVFFIVVLVATGIIGFAFLLPHRPAPLPPIAVPSNKTS